MSSDVSSRSPCKHAITPLIDVSKHATAAALQDVWSTQVEQEASGKGLRSLSDSRSLLSLPWHIG